eukprot:3420579-Rhodomonas_salina.1
MIRTGSQRHQYKDCKSRHRVFRHPSDVERNDLPVSRKPRVVKRSGRGGVTPSSDDVPLLLTRCLSSDHWRHPEPSSQNCKKLHRNSTRFSRLLMQLVARAHRHANYKWQQRMSSRMCCRREAPTSDF